jgi:hypothetical protein
VQDWTHMISGGSASYGPCAYGVGTLIGLGGGILNRRRIGFIQRRLGSFVIIPVRLVLMARRP